MRDQTSTASTSPVATEPAPRTGLLKALGLGLAGVAVMLAALALRSIPLAGQLWNRPELAHMKQQPLMTAADEPPAEAAFRCC